MIPFRYAVFIVCLFGFAVQAQDANFRVEKLSADEIKKFNAAETALKRAKQEHDKIVSELKSHYGDSSDIIWNSFSSCGAKKTSVELRGEYALITSWIDNGSCPIAATNGLQSDDGNWVAVPVEKWHLATKEECDAETQREYESMAKSGIEGDAPITVGFGESDGHRVKMFNPCGYTNGKDFKPRWTVQENGKPEREVSEEEYKAIK